MNHLHRELAPISETAWGEIENEAKRTLAATLDDLGSATFRAEIASARHETQYTRLFRS